MNVLLFMLLLVGKMNCLSLETLLFNRGIGTQGENLAKRLLVRYQTQAGCRMQMQLKPLFGAAFADNVLPVQVEAHSVRTRKHIGSRQ